MALYQNAKSVHPAQSIVVSDSVGFAELTEACARDFWLTFKETVSRQKGFARVRSSQQSLHADSCSLGGCCAPFLLDWLGQEQAHDLDV